MLVDSFKVLPWPLKGHTDKFNGIVIRRQRSDFVLTNDRSLLKYFKCTLEIDKSESNTFTHVFLNKHFYL